MGVSKIGVPQNGWFMMENPIKMDDLGVPVGNTHVWWALFLLLFVEDLKSPPPPPRTQDASGTSKGLGLRFLKAKDVSSSWWRPEWSGVDTSR